MIKWLLLTLLLFIERPLHVKVATYSTGQSDTEGYESLSFWTQDDHRAYIRYARGKDDTEEIELTWSGLYIRQGERAMQVKFPHPDRRIFYIIQKGKTLEVSDATGSYRKTYHWENENPASDARSCSFCAQNEQEAWEILRKCFFKP